MCNENRFERYGAGRRGPAASVCTDFPALCRIILTDTTASRTAMTLCLAAAAMVSLIGGCGTTVQDDAMANSYYLSPRKDLRDLGRVALVEVGNLSDHPGISRDATKALFLELQKKHLFGLVCIGQDDPAWQMLQANPDPGKMMQAMLAIREGRKCDGLLIGTVTEYQPYPRLVIGLHLKLLDLTDGHVLWGVEQIWDSMDKGVRKRVHAYSQSELRSGSAAVPEELVPVSSLEFMKFAACEVAQTLDGAKY
jgi:hypothetical protein